MLSQKKNTAEDAGQQTLELFEDKDLFNQWLFERLTLFCKDNVLEIGSGIGNISKLLLRRYGRVSLSDVEEKYIDILKTKFSAHSSLRSVQRLDISDPYLFDTHPDLYERFDSIVASNVVEHVQNDQRAVANCYNMLRPGGRLIVLVPAFNVLYNSLDKALGHVRRFNKKSLSQLLHNAGFNILSVEFFNALGIPGWWATGLFLRNKIIPAGQLKVYEKLVPLIRYGDRLVMRKVGLSIIISGEK